MTIQRLLKQGDSLSAIANEFLGDPTLYRAIATVNNLDLFQDLPIGINIRIPTKQELLNLAKEKAIAKLEDLLEGKIGDRLDLSRIRQVGGRFDWQLIDWIL